VTEVLFYHLEGQPLEGVLPTLLEKSLERGWRAVVQLTSEERLSALDDRLWTFSDESFLPHGTDREPHVVDQPVVLTLGAGNPNGSSIRFLVEGSALPPDLSAYRRMVVLFDGTDPDALACAREQWQHAKDAGHEVTYWQQDDRGRWEKKA
jgi:DNA polymerase III subunit chi